MSPRPNILVFLTDDHGQWASSAYGNREIVSPTMRWLATTGARMNRAFTPCPVCSPARASFWTGLIPSAHGLHDYIMEGRDVQETHPGIQGRPNLGTRLQAAGYRTGLSGKWHAGGAGFRQDGFDFWYSSTAGTNKRFGKQRFDDNGQSVEFFGHQAPRVTDAAIRFLDQHHQASASGGGGAGDKPFFLFVGYVDTHSPFDFAPPRLVKLYRNAGFDDIPDESFAACHVYTRMPKSTDREQERAHLAQYYAAVTFIDQQMGRVIDHMQSLGLLDDTLIVYTADHGHMCGHHGMWLKGNATLPANLIDESILVPCLWRWPGRIPAGRVLDAPVDHCDLHASLLEAAGCQAEPASPGRSYLPMLGGAELDWREAQFCEYGPSRMVRTQRYKFIKRYPAANGPWPDELFDLQADPRETVNRIDDPSLALLIADLTAQLERYFNRYEDPRYSGLRPGDVPYHNNWQVWDVTPEQSRQRLAAKEV